MDILTDHFLIAMPALEDPNFSHSVTYICEHNEQGAMGIVISRPMELQLSDVFEQMDIEADAGVDTTTPVYQGGPVQPEHGFVIHQPHGQWESTLNVTDTIGVSTSRDIISAIAHGRGPEHFLLALGYAGWGEGQLEEEMAANAWLSAPANERILFDLPPEQRWNAAASLLGIDLNLLSNDIGHA